MHGVCRDIRWSEQRMENSIDVPVAYTIDKFCISHVVDWSKYYSSR
jgi:hypothetical protein